MSNKGQTDYLVCGFLYQPTESEKTISIHSVMFDELYLEQQQTGLKSSNDNPFRSILLESDAMMSSDGRLRKLNKCNTIDEQDLYKFSPKDGKDFDYPNSLHVSALRIAMIKSETINDRVRDTQSLDNFARKSEF